MLVDITTKCNMACEHCIRDFGNGKRGNHMSWDTFVSGIDLMADWGSYVTLSGGEPTLWPHLCKAVDMLLLKDVSVHIVTNGSRPKVVWKLIEMQEVVGHDKLALEMSVDLWHDAELQDLALERHFRRQDRGTYRREGYIRNNVRLVNAGRASSLYDKSEHSDWQRGLDGKEGGVGCVCDTLHIRHDGSIHLCGCDDSPQIGHVNSYTHSVLDTYHQYYDGCDGDRCHRWKSYQQAADLRS